MDNSDTDKKEIIEKFANKNKEIVLLGKDIPSNSLFTDIRGVFIAASLEIKEYPGVFELSEAIGKMMDPDFDNLGYPFKPKVSVALTQSDVEILKNGPVTIKNAITKLEKEGKDAIHSVGAEHLPIKKALEIASNLLEKNIISTINSQESGLQINN